MADSDSTSGKSPAFQFYPKDFVTGTVTLTTEEVGAYILLMCHCWDNGSVPPDVNTLARIARLSPSRMRRTWDVLVTKFTATGDGRYTQPRLERERQKQADYRRKQSDKGKASANRRATDRQPDGNRGSTAVQPEPQPEPNSPISNLQSASPDSRQRKTRAGEFCAWYAEKHYELFGVGYLGSPQKDDMKAQELTAVFTDQELRDAALVWFGDTDDFATNGTRTITKFACRASGYVLLARKVGA